LTDDTKERKWADAQFKKAERVTEGAQAMSEYNAERDAERAKTVRLRELRLAKEHPIRPLNRPHRRRSDGAQAGGLSVVMLS